MKIATEWYSRKHELKPSFPSGTKTIPWVRCLKINKHAPSFYFSVDPELKLTRKGKELELRVCSSKDVDVSANWLAISPSALNIDGDTVTWSQDDSERSGRAYFDPKLGYGNSWSELDKWPEVLTGVNGVRCSASSGHEPHPTHFAVRTEICHTHFDWHIDVCHEECVQELSFSWIVVPKARLTFKLPPVSQQPCRWKKRSKRKTHNWGPWRKEGVEDLGDEVFAGMTGLFE